jgi:hypothetical protein
MNAILQPNRYFSMRQDTTKHTKNYPTIFIAFSAINEIKGNLARAILHNERYSLQTNYLIMKRVKISLLVLQWQSRWSKAVKNCNTWNVQAGFTIPLK